MNYNEDNRQIFFAGGADLMLLPRSLACRPKTTVTPTFRMSHISWKPSKSLGIYHYHNILDLGRSFPSTAFKSRRTSSTTYLNTLRKFEASKIRFQVVRNFKTTISARIPWFISQHFAFFRPVKPPWNLFQACQQLIPKEIQGNSSLFQISHHWLLDNTLSLSALNITAQLKQFQQNPTNCIIPIIDTNKLKEWKGNQTLSTSSFYLWLIFLSSISPLYWTSITMYSQSTMDIDNSNHNMNPFNTLSSQSIPTYRTPTSKLKVTSHVINTQETQAQHPFPYDINRILEVLTCATTYITPYPEENEILAIFSQCEKQSSTNHSHTYLQTSFLERQRAPLLPSAFTDVFTSATDLFIAPNHVSTHNKLCLIGTMWALVRSASEQLRAELLSLEQKCITDVPAKCDQSHLTSSVSRRLATLYTTAQACVANEYRDMHITMLDLLPSEVHEWASDSVYLEGDDLLSSVPDYLELQLRALATDCAMTKYSASKSDSAWSTPSAARHLFPGGLTNAGPQPRTNSAQDSVWAQLLPEHSPVSSAPTPVQASLLRPPLETDIDTIKQLRRETLLRRGGWLSRSDYTLPAQLQDYATLCRYEEATEITRFLLVLNFRQTTSQLTVSSNLHQTMMEAKHIVRSYGYMSENHTAVTSGNDIRHYLNGLQLDTPLMEKHLHKFLLDPDSQGVHHSIILVLSKPGQFGTSTAPAHGHTKRILPLYQRIPHLHCPNNDDTPEFYMVQAIPEYVKPELLPNRRHDLVICRGVPDTTQAHSITATCILAFKDHVIAQCNRTAFAHPDKIQSQIGFVIGSITHRIKTNSTDTDLKVASPKDKARKSARRSRTTIARELVIRAVWLGTFHGKDSQLVRHLQDYFSKHPQLPFKPFGIPMELMASLETCILRPTHLPETHVPCYHTILLNLRPHIPTRQVLLTLCSDIGTWTDVASDLQAIFIQPEVESSTGKQCKWSAVFIWRQHRPGVSLSICQPLAGANPHGGLLPLLSARIDLRSDILPGLAMFTKLGKAYDKTSSKPDSKLSASSSKTMSSDATRRKSDKSSRTKTHQSQPTADRISPQTSPLLFTPRHVQAGSTDNRAHTHSPRQLLTISTPPPVFTARLQTCDSSPEDTSDSDSSYTPSETAMSTCSSVPDQQIQAAVDAATKPLQEQLAQQQQRNSELDAKLLSLTEIYKEEARINRLRDDARLIADRWTTKHEERTNAIDDIALLEAEFADIGNDGGVIPKHSLRRHQQLHAQVTKITAQLQRFTNDIQDICAQLNENITNYINDEDT